MSPQLMDGELLVPSSTRESSPLLKKHLASCVNNGASRCANDDGDDDDRFSSQVRAPLLSKPVQQRPASIQVGRRQIESDNNNNKNETNKTSHQKIDNSEINYEEFILAKTIGRTLVSYPIEQGGCLSSSGSRLVKDCKVGNCTCHHRVSIRQSAPEFNHSFLPSGPNNNLVRSSNMQVGKFEVNIRTIGIGLFVLASIFCIYGILTFKDDVIPKSRFVTELKLVNVFNRHGDRAPSDALPDNDPHKSMARFFWPNGLHNLTDIGKLRQYKVGLELRRHYAKFLEYNSSQILAFSSPIYRCVESLQLTLRGLFDIESNKDRNLKAQYECYMKQNTTSGPGGKKCLPSGSGSPEEYKKIDIDTRTLPALVYEFLNQCKYRKEHPSPVDADLTNSPDIKRLPGIEKLRKTLQETYNQSLNFDSLGLWSSIASEMNLIRTDETLKYAKHYLDWANKPIDSNSSSTADITLFDLFEQAAVLAYRDRVVDEALRVQIGPIMTSLIDSQSMALINAANRTSTSLQQQPTDGMLRYKDKKMILYSGHDSIFQLMLHYLGVVQVEGSFEHRFHKLRRSDDELSKFLTGLRMSDYGMSFKLDLFESRITNTNDKLAFVQMSIYNRADAKYHDVDYKLIPLGTICKRKFMRKYPGASKSDLAKFVPYEFKLQFNEELSCPFELFKKITSDMMIDQAKLKQICDF